MEDPSKNRPIKGKSRNIPRGSEEEIHTWTSYRISLSAVRRLRVLKKKLGFKTYEGVILYLANLAEREGFIPVASLEKLENDTRPCLITGEPGSGENTFHKKHPRKVQPRHQHTLD
ncbi:MAG: hypothetical protein QXJ62_05335 [Nitrososphaeria archaeon]